MTFSTLTQRRERPGLLDAYKADLLQRHRQLTPATFTVLHSAALCDANMISRIAVLLSVLTAICSAYVVLPLARSTFLTRSSKALRSPSSTTVTSKSIQASTPPSTAATAGRLAASSSNPTRTRQSDSLSAGSVASGHALGVMTRASVRLVPAPVVSTVQAPHPLDRLWRSSLLMRA